MLDPQETEVMVKEYMDDLFVEPYKLILRHKFVVLINKIYYTKLI